MPQAQRRSGIAATAITTASLALAILVFAHRGPSLAGAAARAPSCTTGTGSAPKLLNGSAATSLTTTPGPSPFGVAFDPTGRFAFVGEATQSLAVYAVDASGESDKTSGTPPGPPTAHLHLHPHLHLQLHLHLDKAGSTSPTNAQEFYGVASSQSGRIVAAATGSGAAIFDERSLEQPGVPVAASELEQLTSAGTGAIEAIVTPHDRYAFVSLEGSNEVAVFRLGLPAQFDRRGHTFARGMPSLIGYIPTGVAPVGMALSPNGRTLYVTSEASSPASIHAHKGQLRLSGNTGTLTTVDVSTAEHAPTRSVLSTVPVGCDPVRVVASPDGKAVYVTARGSDALVAFSATDLVHHPAAALLGSVEVGEAPVGLGLLHDAPNAGGPVVVVADSNRFGASGAVSNLAVVDVAPSGALTLAGYLPAGGFPRDIAVSPDGRTALVCNFDSGQLEVVDGAALP